ncbi:unnamed protein product [Anisakis simplex]|uniref:Laminin EGF-like domain-containing protein n=1 Tax=Anisakis simplex TaxID=6269 RepID=A0A0M3KEB1_ANISI|nr:unnamed protein product [Anisakis simplex]
MALFDGKSLLPISLSLLSAALLLSLICNTDARVADTSLKSVGAQNGNGASEPKCEFMQGETANCEACIFKGPVRAIQLFLILI